jgi:hypothetical protein
MSSNTISDLEAERHREALAKVEQDLADGECRVAEQEEVVAALTLTGRDALEAQEILSAFRGSLGQDYVRRRVLREALGLGDQPGELMDSSTNSTT